MNKICGVYCLMNTITGKKYIGQSIDINERVMFHFRDFVLSKTNTPLYDAIREYGKNCWKVSILFKLEDNDIENAREILWQKETEFIAKFDSTNPEKGYNLAIGGAGPSGVIPSKETIQKRSESLSGENNPMFGKTGEQHPFFGKHHSDETKQRISKSNIGKHSGENHPMFGKKHSNITIEKMSQIKIGENNPFYGRKHSEETKQKMREAKKRKKALCSV